MKKILIAISALIILGLVSCDESTPNPTDNQNDNIIKTKEDLLTSSLWERKYVAIIDTTNGITTEERINRLEFNKGLVQQTFFLYTYFMPENVFASNGLQIKWTCANDTITLQGTTGVIFTTKLKILKLTQDTLRFERIGVENFIVAPFNDTVKIHTYYKVK